MAPAPISRVRRSGRSIAGRRAREVRRAIGAEIRQLRLDAGISQRRLAEAAAISQGFLSLIEAGQVEPSITVLVTVGDVLNADLSVRLYPSGGPALRDRHQARMVEALVTAAHPAWKVLLEVSVVRPTRGWIDAVLVREDARQVIACEAESTLRRLEHQLRRHGAKADSLPSAEFWRLAADPDRPPTVSRLLLLRSTRANRAVVSEFEGTLALAYPAPSAAVHRSLTQGEEWPGSALLWATVAPDGARLLHEPPRGIQLGR